jgi:hypothetical protein
MARTKLPQRLQLKLADIDRWLLEEISRTLGVDMASTIRLTLREKARTLGIAIPAAPVVRAPTAPAAKKKRRAAP